jgi:HEAT repeat protein
LLRLQQRLLKVQQWLLRLQQRLLDKSGACVTIVQTPRRSRSMLPVLELAASAVAALAPYLSITAEEATKKLGTETAEHLSDLYGMVKDSLTSPAGQEVLAALEKAPADPDACGALRLMLKKQLSEDPVLYVELNALLEQLGAASSSGIGQISSIARVAPVDDPEPYCEGRSLSAWIKRLSNVDRGTRLKAIEAVSKIGIRAKSAIPALQKLVLDPSVSREAMSALCQVAEPTDKLEIAPLITLLSQGESDAARLLGVVRAADGVPALIRALETRSNALQAAWALGQIGDQKAVGPLTTVLGNPGNHESTEYSIAAALTSLGAGRNAIPTLIRIASHSDYNHAGGATKMLKECCRPGDASVILPHYRELRALELSIYSQLAFGRDRLEEVLRHLGVSEVELATPHKEPARGCGAGVVLLCGTLVAVLTTTFFMLLGL